jgi:hypothetical protein
MSVGQPAVFPLRAVFPLSLGEMVPPVFPLPVFPLSLREPGIGAGPAYSRAGEGLT